MTVEAPTLTIEEENEIVEEIEYSVGRLMHFWDEEMGAACDLETHKIVLSPENVERMKVVAEEVKRLSEEMNTKDLWQEPKKE